MGLSIKVISDPTILLEFEESWNRELKKSAKNPFFHIQLMADIMQDCINAGFTPLVFNVWADDQLVGVAPLLLHKNRFSTFVTNLDSNNYPPFVTHDKYQEFFYNQLVCYLLQRLKCRSATITLDAQSSGLKAFKKICKKRKLRFWHSSGKRRATIELNGSFEDFHSSLSHKNRKNFGRLKRKLDQVGVWQVFCSKINSSSIKKILDIDSNSWKSKWRTQNNVKKDFALHSLLRVSQPERSFEQLYDARVWFLEVDGKPIAFQIVLFYNSTAVFIKTSFNEQFKEYSPGKFLMNSVIEECFKKGTVTRIDFVTDLPVVNCWNTVCEERTNLHIARKSVLFNIISIIEKNRLGQKFSKIAYTLLG